MIQTKEVTLNPDQSSAVAFTFTSIEAKTHYVSVNGLTGSFIAITLPAEFVVSDLVITPSTVYIGEQVTISVLVTNVGGTAGTATITLEVT